MEMGPSLLSLCPEVNTINVEVCGFAEIDLSDDGGSNADDQEDAEEVEGGEEDWSEVEGNAKVAEEPVEIGEHSEYSDGAVEEIDEGGPDDEDEDGESEDEEDGEAELQPTQAEMERNIVRHWGSYSHVLRNVNFWYKDYSRDWRRDGQPNNWGEWELYEEDGNWAW